MGAGTHVRRARDEQYLVGVITKLCEVLSMLLPPHVKLKPTSNAADPRTSALGVDGKEAGAHALNQKRNMHARYVAVKADKAGKRPRAKCEVMNREEHRGEAHVTPIERTQGPAPDLLEQIKTGKMSSADACTRQGYDQEREETPALLIDQAEHVLTQKGDRVKDQESSKGVSRGLKSRGRDLRLKALAIGAAERNVLHEAEGKDACARIQRAQDDTNDDGRELKTLVCRDSAQRCHDAGPEASAEQGSAGPLTDVADDESKHKLTPHEGVVSTDGAESYAQGMAENAANEARNSAHHDSKRPANGADTDGGMKWQQVGGGEWEQSIEPREQVRAVQSSMSGHDEWLKLYPNREPGEVAVRPQDSDGLGEVDESMENAAGALLSALAAKVCVSM